MGSEMCIRDRLLGNFGEFVGAIAVVATLGYLAIQVRQSKESMDANTGALEENRKLMRNDVLGDLTRRFEEARYRAQENEQVAALFVRGNSDPESLNEAEKEMFISRLVPYFQVHLMFYQMVEAGFIDPALLEYVDDELRTGWGNTKGARQYWSEVQHLFPHRDHINALLEPRG